MKQYSIVFACSLALVLGTIATANAEEGSGKNPALLNPTAATAAAPNTFQVKVTTSAGDFVMEVNREWAPRGADRFFNLVKIGFYDDAAFFRVILTPRPFMAQIGFNGAPDVNKAWRGARIQDDPVVQSNTRGMVSFATSGPNSRTTQFFVNYADNSNLDGMGFAPFAKVIEGMDTVKNLYSGYGEGAPQGKGPSQGRINNEGNAYLKAEFPKLDYIIAAEIVDQDQPKPEATEAD